MNITLDGQPTETDARDLAALLDALGHAPDAVATALNGEFVARAERASQRLAAGDRVDVVVPIAGG